MSDETQTAPALFEDRGQMLTASSDAAAVARATQEIQAALLIAQRFPRDEINAKKRILQACQRKGLAELAEYEYSRGGTKITGPTIDLLRAIASRWGHVDWGWREVERKDGASIVRCQAWDMQSGARAYREFSVEHWRDTQAGGYRLEDERDIYELLANVAARRVRSCLEEVIDSDIVADAVEQCRKTLKEGEKIPLKERAVKMLLEFESRFSVSKAEIELRLGNALEGISENQFASLRRVFKSLSDGVGKKEDYFKPVPVKPEFGAGGQGPADNGGGSTVGQSGTAERSQTPQPAHGKTTESPPAPAPSEKPIQEPPPTPAAPPADVPGSGYNPLKGIRALCKMSGVKEGELLTYLHATGSTDGSFGTLEELHMAKPELLTLVAESWQTHVPKIKGK